MRVLIFTEGGTKIGLGHIFRCSSLYDEVESRSIEVELIINGNRDEIANIENKSVDFTNWLSEEFLNGYVKENDYCIVDSYLADESLYEIISNKAKNCVFIDDNARLNYPKGIIVNPSLYPLNLYNLNKDNNNYLVGSNYIILRKPFINAKREIVNKEVKQVLITMGGTDIRNLTPVILKQLHNKYINITFNVVSCKGFTNLSEFSNTRNINLYNNIDAEEMKNLMLQSDIAITAAGQTIYELLATQTPFIPIKVIENQKNNAVGLINMKLVNTVLDYKDSQLINKLEQEIDKLLDIKERTELYNRYFSIVDGFGSKRIINNLMQLNYVTDDLYLRKVKRDDIEEVFKLSNEDYVRKYSINKYKIEWDNHLAWFNNILKSKQNVFYVVANSKGEFLGQIRYKIKDCSAVVSISLCKLIMGKGLSSILLNHSIKLFKEEKKDVKRIIAFISTENIASNKLFIKSGFKFYQESDSMLEYHYIINDKEQL